MDPKATFRSAPLLDRALHVVSQRAQTCDSLAQALGISSEDAALYWFSVNSLRRGLGHDLPPLSDATSRCWYNPTWHLASLLEDFQINEGLASHYNRIFYDPEGGHLELNLAANEVVYAIGLEQADVDFAHLRRICVHACEPENGLELLAANAGKILLAIEDYRDEPFTPSFMEHLYAKLTDGIRLKEAEEVRLEVSSTPEQDVVVEIDDSSSCAEGLELLCSFISGNAGSFEGQQGDHCLIVALTTLLFVRTARLFPAGNALFGYLLYLIFLHRAGYHFSAHVPVMRLLYGADSVPCATDRERYAFGDTATSLPADPRSFAVKCDCTFDWTLAFEKIVELLVNEQRWVMTKLEGMSRRRERLRDILEADGSMNSRQKEVLLEALLHSNAEFTYDIHMKRYAISYPSARSDFGRLIDLGFLQQNDDGVRHFFFAADDLFAVCNAYLREHCTDAYLHYYDENDQLRPEFRASEEASERYNRNIGFYEKELLDKMYTEHYDFRRASIADTDGLVRRQEDSH